MNTEPVAWMQVSAIDGTPMKASLVQTWGDDVPLYTHPAKTLTDEEYDNIFANGKRLGVIETEDRFRRAMALTDGEIWAIASEIEPVEIQHGVRLSNELNVLDFARAILRKAQEK